MNEEVDMGHEDCSVCDEVRARRGGMNEEKVLEVLEYVYEQANEILSIAWYEADEIDKENALERIRDKIEELTEDDLGEVA